MPLRNLACAFAYRIFTEILHGGVPLRDIALRRRINRGRPLYGTFCGWRPTFSIGPTWRPSFRSSRIALFAHGRCQWNRRNP